MNCPECQSLTSVIESRRYKNTIRRRRKCDSCPYRFTTRELADMDLKGTRRMLEQLVKMQNALRTLGIIDQQVVARAQKILGSYEY